MNKHLKIAIVMLTIGLVVILIVKFVTPYFANKYAYKTSDAKDTKGRITIALDSWIGYFPFYSPVFKKLMREDGYIIDVIDDDADYSERMEKLKKREIDFAVATIDSYILNGVAEDFPGTIITIIDQSKGGDALVAWDSKINNLNDLKTKSDYKIAFTPDSPSEHLLKSIGFHFGIPELLNKKGSWRVETNGAKDAYKKLINHKVDAAVIWEPHVFQALSQSGVIKLLGTEDTEKLIVDILLVNRTYTEKNADIVNLFLTNYFKTLKIYRDNQEDIAKDIKKITKISSENIEPMLNGVKWLTLYENINWMGLNPQRSYSQSELVEAIESTINILIETNDFDSNPLPNNDPYAIINSYFADEIFQSGISDDSSVVIDGNSLESKFAFLSDKEWEKLREVGSLKLRPITFVSGTSQLDLMGKMQLDGIVENLGHYPKFRILIKGHTGARGDEDANKLLSLERANGVKEYLEINFNVDSNRMRTLGVGGKEPLKKKQGESSRSYNYRLKRVELMLVKKVY